MKTKDRKWNKLVRVFVRGTIFNQGYRNKFVRLCQIFFCDIKTCFLYGCSENLIFLLDLFWNIFIHKKLKSCHNITLNFEACRLGG